MLVKYQSVLVDSNSWYGVSSTSTLSNRRPPKRLGSRARRAPWLWAASLFRHWLLRSPNPLAEAGELAADSEGGKYNRVA